MIPLRVRSHGSLLYGTASPEALVDRALAVGHRVLALTDRDALYLAVRFYRYARDEGVRPVLGATVGDALHEVLLLALDRRGYAHLCEILSRRHLEDRFDVVRAVGALHAGLHVIVESPALAAALIAAGVPAACGVRESREVRPGGLWVGVRGLFGERHELVARVTAARRLGVPLVATGDVVLLDPGDLAAHRAAVTAAAGELLERMPVSAFAAADARLFAPADAAQRVRRLGAATGLPEAAEEALANNALAAERCRLELELGVPIFPHADLAPGETGPARLLALGRAGVQRRFRRPHPPARRRLESELEMIERLGFTDYFLLVAEIVEFARARGIPSVGRGSGASSMVAYCLGITNVDPLAHGLTFERFLNPGRKDCPDLDIDLCWRRRDEVIHWVYERYGADRVAMISTHATLGARSAFRETAKALGVPNSRVNALARRVPRELEKPYLDRLLALPGAAAVDWREPVLTAALRLAETLEGAPRHLSVHSGGVVIGDRPLTHYVPLERAAKGVVVTQFEMRAIEAIGLVKMDLLGNRALTTIGECVTLAARRGLDVDVERLPDPDPATAARLESGDTLNCFQLESPAMRHLLRMLGARTMEEVIAAVALVRPGPAESGMKEAFCRRARGLEPATFAHPRLEPVLRSTHGVMLYEEDVLRVAAALAGLSLAAGDDLRRSIGAARSVEERASLERGFVAHAVRAGVSAETASAVWRDLARFGGYAFCKAHAAGYGALGYQSAYLKTHAPAEWAVAILNHHAGMYSTWVHVEDLRRRGVEFLSPCTRRSSSDTTLEEGRVRVGLARVYGLGDHTVERIVRAREDRPASTLAGFLAGVRPTLPEAESLILAGALDWTRRSRAALLLEVRVTLARVGAARPVALPVPVLAGPAGAAFVPEPVPPAPVAELAEFDPAARVEGEYRATGLWFGGHPLDLWVDPALLSGCVSAGDVERHAGRRVAVAGLPCAWRRVETRTHESMMFLTLADRSGLAECVLFPDAYRRWARSLEGSVLRVEGRVDATLGAISVAVDRVQPVRGPAPPAAVANSWSRASRIPLTSRATDSEIVPHAGRPFRVTTTARELSGAKARCGSAARPAGAGKGILPAIESRRGRSDRRSAFGPPRFPHGDTL